MDKCKKNIAIAEPSAIIYEGLSNILLREGCNHYNLYHFDNIEEILYETPTGKIDLFIANPSLVKGNVKAFHSHKKIGNSMPWVALIYSFFEKEIIDLFDAVIQITDSPETVTYTIQNLVSLKCLCKSVLKEQLTPRETDVLKQLIQGLSNKEIASQLNISTHTVVSHRKNITQKTGIKSQSGLTIYAISNNIINIEDYQE
ncbi:LuxR C-terminal-related transcriptional regulator [uncultured Sunxiuqinia sp.]|uniref:LuxR C-terminal-related transcriptional regulator n=1 Tax=uncultured Sunxiuqinia sp. TaxID=1573825 RepID=UPI002AA7DF61|nr:LuxR C-terminal-related transcriptional regulator [uncultured Sunxiuqinia sp.]